MTKDQEPMPSPSVPLADIAYERIREMVLRRQIRPGEQTSVAKLASQTKLGRSPVKEAITRLVSEGLLQVSDRRGTTAVKLTRSDIADLFELRQIFEKYVASRAAKNITSAELQELSELLVILEEESLSKPPEKQSIAKFIDADVRLHEIIIRSAGNAHLTRHYKLLNLHLQISDYLFRHHTGMREERHRDHIAMVDALRERDGERLATLLEQHSNSVKHVILTAMEVEEADGSTWLNHSTPADH
ncbi:MULTISPECIES: GntR family transcriptional regulator [unclassified Nonomuraea]|uniref:GntR family transcriptional regulator n=1 Tax=unclassified Nonomuraea TaxID=2593643 RepID=UPI0033F2FFE6